MLRIFCALIFLGLTSCSSGPVTFLAPTMISKYLYDRTPISFMAEFFGKRCENISIYEAPKRCRPN